MSEFSYLADKLATTQMNERIRDNQRSGMPRRNRRTARRSLASGLHHLADRLDV